MATAAQGFRRRVKDRVSKEREPIPFFIEVTDEDEAGNEIVVSRDDFTATAPTEEQLMLMMAYGGNSEATVADEVNAIISFFKDVLSDKDYRRLVKRLRDPQDVDVDSELITEIFEMLMEKWQDFPTASPAASSGSRASTGTRSTGRARGKGSIQ